jgi:hypothetical protein
LNSLDLNGVTVELLIGVLLAAGTVVSAKLTGFDKERSFFPVLLMVIATYYILFAAMSGSPAPVLPEVLWAALFIAVSKVAYKRSLWLVVAGLLAHGVFDFVHGSMIDNRGVPAFWPSFCAGFDIVLAGYLGSLLVSRKA